MGETEHMPDVEFICPCCKKPVVLKWHLHVYSEGDSTPVFDGLEVSHIRTPDKINLKGT